MLTHRRTARHVGAVAALAVLLGVVAVGAVGTPATASTGSGVLISYDGKHWSDSAVGNIFPVNKALVPGDTSTGRFYVKNDRDKPEWLRVGLSSLTVTNWDIAQAVTLSTTGTTASDASGTVASFAGNGIVCSDLLQRSEPLAAGGIALVTASLRFRADTSGLTAQGALAGMSFIIQLSDIDLNATHTPLCTGSVQIGPVTPNSHQGGGTNGGGSGGGGGSGDGTGSGNGAGDGSGDGSGTNPDGSSTGSPDVATATGTISLGLGGGSDTQLVEPANTMRLYEEYAILILIGAALAGMLLRLGAQRRWGSPATPIAEEDE